MDEVNTPDMVGVSGAQPDNGTVFMIQAFALLVALWELQAFFSPQTLNLLVIDPPSFHTQQLGNLPISITAIGLGQSNQSQPKAVIFFGSCFEPVGGACYANRSAAAPLRRPEFLAHMDHSLTQISSRQALGFK
tara:strand:- start:291 stop:692 length:402 start_codon:yes stop_codon:yes gene_type:complete